MRAETEEGTPTGRPDVTAVTLPPLRWPPIAIAGGLAVLLLAVAGRYGYHRDELYYLAAGDHPAWGYPDQGPLVPTLAHLVNAVFPGSLVALRAPSALVSAGTVLTAALVSRELGGERRVQTVAASCTAVSGFVLGAGHLFSTTTFDLLAWTVVAWLAIRGVRRRERHVWLVVGVVAGLALLTKPLIPFLLVALLVGILISGPREVLRNPWVWVGGLLAMVIASPYLGWQAQHGWPQLDMARAIAGGSSGSSEPRWAILPMQLLLVSPLLAPVWVAGLVRLFRDDDVRDARFVGWAYVVLFVIFTVTGGKPYYLAQLSPTLLGVGAAPAARWARTRAREVTLGAAIVLSLVIGGTITLPVLPAADAAGVVASNYDAGETIGWHAFVADVTRAADMLPTSERANAVILTNNYGEAGALQRFGSHLPPVYSGHNGYGYWGPPPAGARPVIAVGDLGGQVINGVLTGCSRVGTVNNRLGIDNDEQGAPIWRCQGPRTSWTQAWPTIRFLG